MDVKEEFKQFIDFAGRVIIGKEEKIILATSCLLAKGHLLIEDIPGVGKTTTAKFLAKAFSLPLKRIQCTNDLLPSDLLGYNKFNPKSSQMEFVKGPIFSPFVLADELNRATPKCQSALLEVMEESTVTIDGQTHQAPHPFFVVATQNPRNQIGTYPLPESQLDRFLMKMKMGRPSKENEVELLLGKSRNAMIDEMQSFFSIDELLAFQSQMNGQIISRPLAVYIANILELSRMDSKTQDLSPRAGLDLLNASKALSYIRGRDHVLPEDIQFIAPAVLSHRLYPEQTKSSGDLEQFCLDFIRSVPVDQ